MARWTPRSAEELVEILARPRPAANGSQEEEEESTSSSSTTTSSSSCTLSFERFTGGWTPAQLQQAVTRAGAGGGAVVFKTLEISPAQLNLTEESVIPFASFVGCLDSLEELAIFPTAGPEPEPLAPPLPTTIVDKLLLAAARNAQSRLQSLTMSAAGGSRAFIEFCERFVDTLENVTLSSDMALPSSSAYTLAVGLSALTRVKKVTLHCCAPHASMILLYLRAPSIQEVDLDFFPSPMDQNESSNIAQSIKLLLSCSPCLRTLRLKLPHNAGQDNNNNNNNRRFNALSFLSGTRVTPSLQSLKLDGFLISLSNSNNSSSEWEPAFPNTTLQTIDFAFCYFDENSLSFFNSFQGLAKSRFLNCQGEGLLQPSNRSMNFLLRNSPLMRSFNINTKYDPETSNAFLVDLAHLLEEKNGNHLDSIEYDIDGHPNNNNNGNNNVQAISLPAIANVVRHSRGSLILHLDGPAWHNIHLIAEGLRLNNSSHQNHGGLKHFQLNFKSFEPTTNDLVLLLEAANQVKTLEALHLSLLNWNDPEHRRTVLVDHRCAALVSELIESATLKKLVLGSCGLLCDSLALIANCLHFRQQPFCLGFDDVCFESGFLQLLGSALPNLGCLQELSLCLGSVNPEDLLPFMENLPSMGHLKVLRFRPYDLVMRSNSSAEKQLNQLLVAGVEHNTSLMQIHDLRSEGVVSRVALKQVKFYLKLNNRYGRYMLSLPPALDPAPISLWPHILANIAKDDENDSVRALHYFLKSNAFLDSYSWGARE